MKKSLRIGLFGFLIWLIPFAVSIFIFPLKTSTPALFESIMPVVITTSVVFFSILHFRKVGLRFIREGVVLGAVWFVISLALDLLMFMWGPMKMTFINYMMDIGLTYLIIPTVTIGIGYLIEQYSKRP
jgi:hypothetical protein